MEVTTTRSAVVPFAERTCPKDTAAENRPSPCLAELHWFPMSYALQSRRPQAERTHGEALLLTSKSEQEPCLEEHAAAQLSAVHRSKAGLASGASVPSAYSGIRGSTRQINVLFFWPASDGVFLSTHRVPSIRRTYGSTVCRD